MLQSIERYSKEEVQTVLWQINPSEQPRSTLTETVTYRNS